MIIKGRKSVRVGIDTAEKPVLRVKNRRASRRANRVQHYRTPDSLFLPHRLHI